MEDALKLMRHHLGAIDLAGIDDGDELSEQERRDYCAAISAVFPRLEKDIKKFLFQQLLFMAKEAGDWEQVMFGRGALEGMVMLLEHWKTAHGEHMKNNSDGAAFDRHNPLSEM